MSIKEKIKGEIEALPEGILEEVYDFIQFLETKKQRSGAHLLLNPGRLISGKLQKKLIIS